MNTILPTEIKDNLFAAINDEWMLITAKNKAGQVNTMTASWGGFGILWGRPICFCVIRPQRYTLGFVQEAERLTLSFLTDGHRDALSLCGRKSGRDCDKITEAGLHLVHDNDLAYFEESRLVICGKKLYTDQIKKDSFLDPALAESVYPRSDYHHVFVCEIERVLTL